MPFLINFGRRVQLLAEAYNVAQQICRIAYSGRNHDSRETSLLDMLCIRTRGGGALHCAFYDDTDRCVVKAAAQHSATRPSCDHNSHSAVQSQQTSEDIGSGEFVSLSRVISIGVLMSNRIDWLLDESIIITASNCALLTNVEIFETSLNIFWNWIAFQERARSYTHGTLFCVNVSL